MTSMTSHCSPLLLWKGVSDCLIRGYVYPGGSPGAICWDELLLRSRYTNKLNMVGFDTVEVIYSNLGFVTFLCKK